eukprot:NODE_1791_length_755_cov_292.771955_g1392_i0.p1 GENE.NODE_1791_length_755_cov_292.771955_g1392_i0~~NODE_1791_length_755_cov_292.771955_g1392_i0.p1  ORF type:complete len:211 (+),score=69.45 NODE_1791_length_755_cov_292.771955_g1392_i0:62-634(+)
MEISLTGEVAAGAVDAKEVTPKIEEWLDSLPEEALKLSITEQEPGCGLVGMQTGGVRCGAAADTLFVYSAPNVNINIGFDAEVSAASGLEEVRERLSFVALDQLPMPGFDCPSGWKIKPCTPVSSFKDGVTIHAFENGRIRYTVETKFFAVTGNVPSRQVPCRASPPGTFVSVERSFKGVIDVDLPMFAQ